jgi:hypothetical protein
MKAAEHGKGRQGMDTGSDSAAAEHISHQMPVLDDTLCLHLLAEGRWLAPIGVGIGKGLVTLLGNADERT